MADSTLIYDSNFFFRDFVTEDILAYCIGETTLYHYKETIIGVRDMAAKLAFFVKLDTIPKTDSPFAPTLDMLTQEHINEALAEIDQPDEKVEYMPIYEIVQKGKELLSHEMSRQIDKQFGVA